MAKAKLHAVLFDLGDTLVELGEGRGTYEERLAARVGHVYDVLAAAGVPLPAREPFCRMLAVDSEAQYHAALAEMKGITIHAVMRSFLGRQGIAPDEGLVEAAAAAYCRGGNSVPSPLRQGAIGVLTRLRASRVKLGAISNTVQTSSFMHESLVRRGLAPFFDIQVYSSEAGVAKPHPAIFRRALDAIGVQPGCAAFVGDRLSADVAGSQAAGMKGILIEVAHRIESDPSTVPDARIGELPELLDVLPRLFDLYVEDRRVDGSEGPSQ